MRSRPVSACLSHNACDFLILGLEAAKCLGKQRTTMPVMLGPALSKASPDPLEVWLSVKNPEDYQ
jgi:hypothetical protein